MCKLPIEDEFNQFLMEFKNLKIEYFNLMIKNIVSNKKSIKNCILSNFIFHIQNEKSFALYDEKVFEIYTSILESYKVFLKQYKGANVILNDNIQKNLGGIIAVLESQISFFDEKDNFGINPILAEKKQIIANRLDIIYEKLNTIIKIKIEDLITDFIQNDDDQIKQVFLSYLTDEIGKCYEENLKACFYSINDNENRRIISYYNDILAEEREILSSIIKVQIKALEDLCENDEEKDILNKLLKPIKEIYQFSNKEFDCLTENIKSINASININIQKDTDDIFKIFEDILNVEHNETSVSKDKILNSLKHFINKRLYFKYEETIQNLDILKKDIKNTNLLFESINNKFIELYKFIEQNLNKYNETEFKDILNGIFESINIKLENLKESGKEYILFCKNLEKDIQGVKDFDINSFDYNLNETFNYFIKQEFEQIIKYIDKNIFDKNFYKYTNLIEKFNKNIYNFKKDVILFEITTFQEIINYSVVRLRESEKQEIIEFVLKIDQLIIDIQKILEINYIIMINPKPHTLFNVKEHEILIAEKSDEFKKGEIIKVLNCGYKILDEIIIRANVIAAK